ncbi:hypothetical protein CFC21_044437 [Triticum aestivum]|uniref:Uncharacterized protein n=2 Tax=Triticum aestivum TaxID=4565 RepID=A0A9R1FQB3_WHEAT|nr:hypothetical protein CFC21_044437 [Triticum aestivum]
MDISNKEQEDEEFESVMLALALDVMLSEERPTYAQRKLHLSPGPEEKGTVGLTKLHLVSGLQEKQIVSSNRHEIHDMMAMLIADGAIPGTDEHFYASQLLLEQKYRDVFSSFKGFSPSVRLGWIKRTWELNNF